MVKIIIRIPSNAYLKKFSHTKRENFRYAKHFENFTVHFFWFDKKIENLTPTIDLLSQEFLMFLNFTLYLSGSDVEPLKFS